MDLEEFPFCIVGGGIAGVSCIEQILETNPEAKILLITSSPVVKRASNIIPLTKTLQDFIVVERTLKSFKDVHQGVTIVQDALTALDSKNKIVSTSSKGSFRYSKLCICTGASPKRIFPELKSERILGIRDTDSVQELSSKISSARRVILVGNGGIATEFVYEVQGVEVIWVVKDSSISSHYVDSGAAEFFLQSKLSKSDSGPCKRMKYDISGSKSVLLTTSGNTSVKGSALGPDWHEGLDLQGSLAEKNVKIEYETEVKCLLSPQEVSTICKEAPEKDTHPWPIHVQLTNGKVYGTDLIISATGVLPNCGWFEGKADPEKGIFVDESMRTSIPDVYAAGDVCYPNWTWPKHWFQMRLWTQARQMGLYLGKCVVNLEENQSEIEPDFCFELFSHCTRFFGFKVVLIGLYNGQGLPPGELSALVRCTKNLEFIKVIIQNSRMQGAILIGETGLEETFENLILNQIDISPYGEDLLNPDIDIEDYFD